MVLLHHSLQMNGISGIWCWIEDFCYKRDVWELKGIIMLATTFEQNGFGKGLLTPIFLEYFFADTLTILYTNING